MRRKFLMSVLAALFAALVVGCGGGGGAAPAGDANAPQADLDPTTLQIEFD